VETARKVFNFNDVWTLNGNVYCKFEGKKHHIKDFCNIKTL